MAQQFTTNSQLKEKEFKEGDTQDQCPICLTQFNPKETVCALPCEHCFHRMCVERWLKECVPTCPVCRHNVMLERAPSAAIHFSRIGIFNREIVNSLFESWFGRMQRRMEERQREMDERLREMDERERRIEERQLELIEEERLLLERLRDDDDDLN